MVQQYPPLLTGAVPLAPSIQYGCLLRLVYLAEDLLQEFDDLCASGSAPGVASKVSALVRSYLTAIWLKILGWARASMGFCALGLVFAVVDCCRPGPCPFGAIFAAWATWRGPRRCLLCARFGGAWLQKDYFLAMVVAPELDGAVFRFITSRGWFAVERYLESSMVVPLGGGDGQSIAVLWGQMVASLRVDRRLMCGGILLPARCWGDSRLVSIYSQTAS